MRAKLIVCAITAALAAIAAGPVSANAEEVVFKANGKALESGAPLHGISYNVTVYDPWGMYGCDGWIDGEVVENPGATIEFSESKFFYPAKEEQATCHALGFQSSSDLSVTFDEPLNLLVNEEGEIEGTSFGTFKWRGCEYETTLYSRIWKEESFFYLYGGEFQPFCWGGAIFDGEFKLSSEGEQVTAEVN